MAESDLVKEVVNQVAVQVETVVMMALRDTEAGPNQPAWWAIGSHKKQRHSGPILVKPVFN